MVQTGSTTFTVTFSAIVTANYALADLTSFAIAGLNPSSIIQHSTSAADLGFAVENDSPQTWTMNHQPAWLPVNTVTGVTSGTTT